MSRSVEILYAVTLAKTSRAAGQVAQLLELFPDLEVGRQELALFQHHDAITGTSRKSVTEHYNQRYLVFIIFILIIGTQIFHNRFHMAFHPVSWKIVIGFIHLGVGGGGGLLMKLDFSH